MRQRLAGAIERVRAEDPRALCRRTAELEGQLQERPVTLPVEPRLERVEVPVLRDDQVARPAQLITELTAVGRQLRTMLDPRANPLEHPWHFSVNS